MCLTDPLTGRSAHHCLRSAGPRRTRSLARTCGRWSQCLAPSEPLCSPLGPSTTIAVTRRPHPAPHLTDQHGLLCGRWLTRTDSLRGRRPGKPPVSPRPEATGLIEVAVVRLSLTSSALRVRRRNGHRTATREVPEPRPASRRHRPRRNRLPSPRTPSHLDSADRPRRYPSASVDWRRPRYVQARPPHPSCRRIRTRTDRNRRRPRADAYLDVLDRALADHVLSHAEVAALIEVARTWGLSGDRVHLLHQQYLAALRREVAAAGTPGQFADLEARLRELTQAL